MSPGLVVAVAGRPLPVELAPEDAWALARRLGARGLPVTVERPRSTDAARSAILMRMPHLEGTPTGPVLTALRGAKGYNQRALAVAFGVNQAQISRYENGVAPLPRSVWLRAADAMGLKHDGAEPGPEETHPSWLLAFDFDGSGAFVQVVNDDYRVAVAGDGELACATAAALTALGNLPAFALPVWASYITEREGPDLVSLNVEIAGASPAVNDLESRRRAATFIAGAMRARLRHAKVSEGLEAVEEVTA